MQNTITCVGYKNEYTQKNGVLISYSSTSYENMFKLKVVSMQRFDLAHDAMHIVHEEIHIA